MSFIHLHTHSDYSPQDGAQSVKMIASKTATIHKVDSVALTDHGRCGGLLQFKKACEKQEIKPIYGFEAYLAPKSRHTKEKLEDHTKTSYHLTLLAKTEQGLKNLFKLSSLAWIEGFYYKPRIDMEILREYSEGIVALSGCGAGYLPHMLMTGDMLRAKWHAHEMVDIFQEDFYIEVQNHNLDWQKPLKTMLFEFSDSEDIPIVVTQDSHYLNREDADMHRAICKIAAGDLEFEGDDSFFKSEEEMKEMFDEEEYHAIHRTQEVADKCNCEWGYDKTIWPVYPIEEGKTPAEELREKAYEGFNKRFETPTEEYRERIEYELGVIEKMDFPTYFLVVADFINWSKTQGIPVGPGRGSGAGSIVAYCLGITELDPIQYGLYFERFLNPDRVSLPDFDVDFCKRRRDEVVQYVKDKYGEEKVAQIGTYSEFKPRGSLRAFARVLGYPSTVGDQLSNMVPPNVAGKTLKFEEVVEACPAILKHKCQDVVGLARKAEKLISLSGVHAAGVLISDSDISTQVPLFTGKSNEIAAQFDMHDVEEVGLVKYDFLGLKNLTVIDDTIRLVKRYHGIEIDIGLISMDDQEVFQNVFQTGKLDGIFQFETSSGFRDLCIKVKPTSIKDLAAITSLFRPGPLGTGLTEKYVEGRNGGEIKYLFPELEPILCDAYGVLTFQEQIMRICTDIAGYTLAEADNMRKIIGKKLPEKMKLEREKFIGGCVKNNIEEAKATELFNDIEGFAKYCFNLAHAAAYSVISYQTAWLKTYYLEEFCCALLDNSIKDQDDLVKYVYMCKENQIPILPPDTNISESEFVLDNGTIMFGLSGVKGFGGKAGKDLMERRPEKGFTSIEHMVSLGVKKNHIKALAKCGALEEISDVPRERLVENLDPLIEYYKKNAKYQARLQKIEESLKAIKIWEANPEGPRPRKAAKVNEKHIPVMPELVSTEEFEGTKLSFERQTLGFYLTGHPMDSFPGLVNQAAYTIDQIKNGVDAKNRSLNGIKVNIPVVISSVNKIRTKAGKDMAALMVEDKTGRMEATLFPNQWKKLKDLVREDTVNIIKGNIKVAQMDDERPPIVRVVINAITPIDADSGAVARPFKVTLKDGTVVEFTPPEGQNISKWQQAFAIVENAKRMG